MRKIQRFPRYFMKKNFFKMINWLSELFNIIQEGETGYVFEIDIGTLAVGFDARGSTLPDIDFF